MTGALEREIKLRFDSPVLRARDAVLALGARPVRPRRLQARRAAGRRRRGCSAARSARFACTEDGQRVRSTFKGPPQPSLTFKGPPQRPSMKLREEIETRVGDGVVLRDLRAARVSRAVPVREVPRGVHDRTACSSRSTRRRSAPSSSSKAGRQRHRVDRNQALGRGPADYVVESYRSLFVQHCAAHGVPPDRHAVPSADRTGCRHSRMLCC